MSPKNHQEDVVNANWHVEKIDGGSMLLIAIKVSPEDVQRDVGRRLAEAVAKAPTPKGFRTGKVAASVVRRLHGKRVLSECRDDLLLKTFAGVLSEASKKHNFDRKKAGSPISLTFSEEKGLSYEILVSGLTPPPAPGTTVTLDPGATVTLDPPKKEQ